MKIERTAKIRHARLMSRLRATTFLVGAGSLWFAHPALANPQGGVVVGGQATITAPAANTVAVSQSSRIAIIDWSSFNIAKGETTRFVQPNASSTTINRIGGQNPSVILGELDANGRVVLINGNGLVFGAGSKINVGSLIATTHDASNADLMSGKATFDGAGSATASITNNGRITASSGAIGLIAPAVANNGTIRARLGSVTLGAATEFTLDFAGDGLISFPVDAQALSRALVANNGRIEGATVLLTAQAAQGVIDNVISMAGLIRATSTRQSGGSIMLDGGAGGVSVTGTLDASDRASGATGGSIQVLGNSVTLGSTARLDASGDAGGGSILVGGNFHGAGPQRNATTTVVEARAALSADAITRGDGGRVAVWADGTTAFAGAISARGGADGGNGGSVETSGKLGLTVADGATVDTLAPKGQAGDWLLDPANIIVATGGSGTLAQGSDASDTTSSITIAPATIDAATSNVILAASTSIAVNSAISMTVSGVGITFEGAGSTPTAGPSSGTTLAANVSTNNGAVTINGPATLGGNVIVTAGTGAVDFTSTVDGAHVLTISNSGGDTFGGAVGGTIALTGLSTGTGLTTLDGNVSTTNGAVTMGGAAALGGDLTISSGTGLVKFTGAVDGAYALTVTGSGGVTFDSTVGSTAALTGLTTGTGTATLDGNVTTANGAVTMGGVTTLGGNITITAGTGAVDFAGAVNGAHALTLSNSGGDTFSSTIGATTALTSLSTGTGTTTFANSIKTTNGDVTIHGPATLGGNVTLTAGTGAVDFTSTVDGAHVLTTRDSGGDTFGGVVGGTMALTGLSTGTGTTTLDGNVSTTNANVVIGGATTLGADVTLTTGTGTVSFTGAVSGAHTLTISNSGSQWFEAGFTGLTGLTTGSGTTYVTGGAVSVSGPMVLGGGVQITAVANPVSFNGTVDGAHALTITGSGGVTFGGAVGATTPLTILTTGTGLTTLDSDVSTNGAVTINGATALGGALTISSGTGLVKFTGAVDGAYALTVTGGGGVTFDSTVGATTALTGLTTGTGTATLDGNLTTANGAVTFNGAAALGADVTITAGTGAVDFAGTVNGAHALTISNSGGDTFSSTIGATTALTSLSTGTGTTTFANNIKTNNGAVTINGPATLGGNVTLTAGTGAVDFTGTVDGAYALTISNSGGDTFGGAVGATTPLASLSTGTGLTTLDGNVSTNNGAVTMGGATALGADLTISSGTGLVKFTGAVNGAHALTVTGSGGATLDGNVTTTNGAVTINGATTLGGNITITAGTGAVDFAGAVNGAHALTLSNSGGDTFSSTIGATTALTSLSTGTGTTTLDGNVSTTNGAVTINGAATLGGNVTLTAGTGAVDFTGTVDGAYALTIGNSGGVTFGGAVGAATPLTSLSTGTGLTTLDGNVSTTNGAVTMGGATALGADLTVNAGTGAISFDSTVDGAHALTLTTSGTMLLDNVVGGATALASLTTGTGQAQLNGNVTTTGVQSYGGPVQLLGPLIMRAGAGNVTFAGTLQSSSTPAGFNSSTVNTSGVTTFDGAVDLGGELLVTGTGPVIVNADITVGTALLFNGPVTLNTSTLTAPPPTGNGIEFNSTLTLTHDATMVTGAGVYFVGDVNGAYNLTLNAGLSAFFQGAGNTVPLASLTTSSETVPVADITTTGQQSYGGEVLLDGSVAMTTSNAAVSFASTIDTLSGRLPENFSVSTGTGQQTYGGALGGASALGTVVLSGDNAAGVSLPAITASGPVTITAGGPLTVAGINTAGDILASTQTGDLSVTGAVATTSTTATALTLEAGSSADRVASPGVADTNGDVVIAGGGSLSTGSGGSGVIYTGSIAGSTGLSGVVGAGDYRYWSDTHGNTGYTTALGAGLSAVYREQPVIAVGATAADSGRTYDGTTTTATLSVTGLVNGDAGTGTGTVSVTSGDASAVLLNAGSYTLSATNIAASGGLAGLGYAVQAGNITYVIAPVSLSITGVAAAGKTYDGTATATLTNTGTLTGLIGGQTLTLAPGAASFADADAGSGKIVTVTGYTLGDGSGLASNYVLVSTTAMASATITPALLTAGLTGTVARTYDGTAAASLAVANYTLSGTIFGNDSVTLNDPAAGTYADVDVGSGKTVSVSGLALDNANYQLASMTISAPIGTINPASTTASGPPQPPPSVATTGLTSVTSVTYDSAVAADLTIPTDTFRLQPIVVPTNLVGTLYVDPGNLIGAPSGSTPTAESPAPQLDDTNKKR